jgi:16S rRNA G527 N7-methylase RsmG
MNVPFYKRLLSFLYPVLLANRQSIHNPVLELYLYCNRWQLATPDALYSDGHRYLPLRKAFRLLRQTLPAVQNVLLLGTGLGSAAHILHRMGLHPRFTLVDIDAIVLQLALELMPESLIPNVEAVCADAATFVMTTKNRYDLVVIDVFTNRSVPAFATSTWFLEKCHALLTRQGHLILNYIPEHEQHAQAFSQEIIRLFPQVQILSLGDNRVLVARGNGGAIV